MVEVDVEASNERWPQRDLFGTDQSPAGPIAGSTGVEEAVNDPHTMLVSIIQSQGS